MFLRVRAPAFLVIPFRRDLVVEEDFLSGGGVSTAGEISTLVEALSVICLGRSRCLLTAHLLCGSGDFLLDGVTDWMG